MPAHKKQYLFLLSNSTYNNIFYQFNCMSSNRVVYDSHAFDQKPQIFDDYNADPYHQRIYLSFKKKSKKSGERVACYR